jgi:hypothetical protein
MAEKKEKRIFRIPFYIHLRYGRLHLVKKGLYPNVHTVYVDRELFIYFNIQLHEIWKEMYCTFSKCLHIRFLIRGEKILILYEETIL